MVSFVARPVDASSKLGGLVVYQVILTGWQEPVTTNGWGNAVVTLNTITGAVTVSGNYQALSSAQTLAHIHGPAPLGMTAGIITTLTGTGGTSGTFSGSDTFTAGEEADMLAGLHYLNIHTTMHIGGEIRGQIAVSVPAMSDGQVALLVAGALVLGVVLVLRQRTPAIAKV
jgi:hypothetical protein